MPTIRPQRDSDVTALIRLAQRSFHDVESAVDEALGGPLDRLATPSWADHHEAVVRGVVEEPASTVLVAEDGDAPVGFVAFRVHDATPGMSRYGEVELIVVAPEHRGRGLGRSLLDYAVDELREAGAPVVMLQTGGDDGHGPARALYEAAGFRPLPTTQYWLPGVGH